MTEETVRKLLAARIAKAGGLRKWCKISGANNGHTCDFLNGKRHPATDVLDALGLEYRIVRKTC